MTLQLGLHANELVQGNYEVDQLWQQRRTKAFWPFFLLDRYDFDEILQHRRAD